MYQCGYAWHPDPCIILALQGLEIVSDGSGAVGFSSIEGWAGGTAATGGPVARAAADGGVDGEVFFGPRTITIEGDIDAPDHDEFALLVEEVGSVLTMPRRDLLVVDESVHLGLVRQVEVVRMRPPMITQLGPRHAIFTLTLESASHLRLDADEQSVTVTPGNGVQVRNIGTMDASLYATLHGPLTDPAVTVGSTTWAYQSTIPAGKRRIVDFTRRRVVDPETGAHSRLFATHGWPSIPPGESRLAMGGTGSGRGEFSWRSTWA